MTSAAARVDAAADAYHEAPNGDASGHDASSTLGDSSLAPDTIASDTGPPARDAGVGDANVFDRLAPANDSAPDRSAPTDSSGTDAAPALSRPFFTYLPSWSESYFDSVSWDGSSRSDEEIRAASKLASAHTAYSHVLLAFAKPDLSFSPDAVSESSSCTGTGLDFSAPCRAIARAISILRGRGVRVLLAVGGATYNGWSGLANEAGLPIDNTKHKRALRDLVDFLGADGLDVDYEVEGAPGSLVATEYAKAIVAMREAVDSSRSKHRLLSLAGWSTGADCTGAQFAAAATNVGCAGPTYWGGSAGRERDVFRTSIASLGTGASFDGRTTVGELLDAVNVMSYDARFEHYDGTRAYQLYRSIYSRGLLSIGLETAPEGWAGGVLVCRDRDASSSVPGTMVLADQEGTPVMKPYSVERMTRFVRTQDATGGAMLWHMLKQTAPPGACNPDGVIEVVSEWLGK